ncbi:MAG: MGMT family protein [Candidatus Omnitrophica bacterium]|nr:MGMT family protein [Candidatus Omnitrophota bacterium]
MQKLPIESLNICEGVERILTRCTTFERDVFRAVCAIPLGEVRTYQWVAEKIGRPRAARAVGQALRKNPLPLLIPCHRVVAGGGMPGGYSRGVALKKLLLDFEQALSVEKKKL